MKDKLINLPKKDIETLIEGINNPPQPNEELKKATEIYREISDEEIWKLANEIGSRTKSSIAAQYFYHGAEWYRKQLKQRNGG